MISEKKKEAKKGRKKATVNVPNGSIDEHLQIFYEYSDSRHSRNIWAYLGDIQAANGASG
jgi:hypothetical protein